MTPSIAPTPSVVELSTANPAPLGLCAFGMTTVLLNVHNAGFFPMNAMILAMGLCYGGLAQVVAGIMEAKKNNTFGFTAFTSYGFFWLSLVALLVMPKLGWAPAANEGGMIAYFALWALFTFVLFIGTLKLNLGLQVVFATLTLLFLLLIAGEATGNSAIKTFTGYEGICCGLSAIYTGMAQVLNETYGRVVLPIGPVNGAAH
jgi:succinate-acetate transporter protein